MHKNTKTLLAPIVLLLLLTFGSHAKGLKGTYTIDPSGSGTTNFISFTDAVQELQDSGVAGPVVFNVADGYYYEYVLLDSTIRGTSATKTITFQSQSLDSTKVILYGAYSSGFILDNVSYVTIRLMTICTGLSMGTGVFIENKSSYNTIEKCIFLNNYDGIYLNSNGFSNVKNNTIRYNHISGQSTGIQIESSIYSMVSDLVISSNIIDSSIASIFIERSEHILISSNYLYAPVYMYLNYSSSAKDASLLWNNFIWVDDSNQINSALYLLEFQGINVFSNSVYSKEGSAIKIFKALDKSQIKNNIFYNAGNGVAMEAEDPNSAIYDYNDLYSNGKVLCINDVTNYSNLKDWQKDTKMDAHSISVFPFFKDTATGDLHLTNLSPISLDSGIYITPDSLDIDGDKRNKTHVWLGADEYLADTVDAGITSILYPLNNSCGDSNMSVRLKVHNFGVRSISNFNIGIFVNGASNDSTTFYFKDSMRAGKDTLLTMTFLKPWNSSLGGNYIINAFTTLHGDQFSNNDSIQVNVKINAIPKTPSILLQGKDTLIASYSGDSCRWYLDSVVVSTGKCEYVPLKSGKYQVLVYDSACPSPMSAAYHFTFSGVEEPQSNYSIQISPNPFTDHTNINYTLDKSESVLITVFDMTGRSIATLVNSQQSAGAHQIAFYPGQYSANPARVYLLKMSIGSMESQYRLINLK